MHDGIRAVIQCPRVRQLAPVQVLLHGVKSPHRLGPHLSSLILQLLRQSRQLGGFLGRKQAFGELDQRLREPRLSHRRNVQYESL